MFIPPYWQWTKARVRLSASNHKRINSSAKISMSTASATAMMYIWAVASERRINNYVYTTLLDKREAN